MIQPKDLVYVLIGVVAAFSVSKTVDIAKGIKQSRAKTILDIVILMPTLFLCWAVGKQICQIAEAFLAKA